MALPDDAERLANTVRDLYVKLFSIDPIVAFLGGGIDTHKDSSVRQALRPLSDVAQATGAAATVVLHTNKSSTDDPLLRIGGTIGFPVQGRRSCSPQAILRMRQGSAATSPYRSPTWRRSRQRSRTRSLQGPCRDRTASQS
jgi:hypothetical protein